MNDIEQECDERQPEVLRVFQSKQETKAFYDRISGVYDLLTNWSERPLRRAGLRKLNAQPGEAVLEIGFGTGHCLVPLAQAVGRAGKIYGLDLSREMRKRAQERLKQAGLAGRVELTCGDAVRMPYPAAALDAVFMSFVLELFDTAEISQVLAEALRVLRPGGRIVIVSLSKAGKRGLALRTFEWLHRRFPHFMNCRPIFVRNALEAAGFHSESVNKAWMWGTVEIALARKVAASFSDQEEKI